MRFSPVAPVVVSLLMTFAGCSTDDGGGAASDLGSDTVVDVSPDARSSPEADGVCVAALELDDACPDDDAACRGSLRCIRDTCRLESLDGEPCDGSGDCVDDHFCERYDLEGRDLPDPLCRADVRLDAECERRNFPCQSPWNCIRGTCQQESTSGGPCDGFSDCDGSDLYCNEIDTADDGEPGVCRPLLLADAACEPTNDGCADGLVCVDATCVPEGVDGEACDGFSDCADGLYCDRRDDNGDRRVQGVCRAEHAQGEACQTEETSNCDSSRCVAGTCVDDQPAGALCDSSGDCGDDLYCDESD